MKQVALAIVEGLIVFIGFALAAWIFAQYM